MTPFSYHSSNLSLTALEAMRLLVQTLQLDKFESVDFKYDKSFLKMLPRTSKFKNIYFRTKP